MAMLAFAGLTGRRGGEGEANREGNAGGHSPRR